MWEVPNEYGVENTTRFALIHLAPLTASGKNEIVATARYKMDLNELKRSKREFRGPEYVIVKKQSDA